LFVSPLTLCCSSACAVVCLCSGDPRDLHSFPTRRSSDLRARRRRASRGGRAPRARPRAVVVRALRVPDAGMVSRSPLVAAIDGPAGVGKSTVARLLAARLGLPYLDTGAMYRALTLHLLDRGVDPNDRAAVAAALPEARIELRVEPDGSARVLLAGEPVESRIRTPEVADATSRAAVHPEVRERMVTLQRELAGRHGGVMEGRDIGTRVVPDAPFKFFFE